MFSPCGSVFFDFAFSARFKSRGLSLKIKLTPIRSGEKEFRQRLLKCKLGCFHVEKEPNCIPL
jgi:hypothetical protein